MRLPEAASWISNIDTERNIVVLEKVRKESNNKQEFKLSLIRSVKLIMMNLLII